MQQKWDRVDTLINSCFEELETDAGYNDRLMERLEAVKVQGVKNFAAAFGFIMAGLLLFMIYTTDIRYRLIDLRLQINYEISSFENFLSNDNTRLRE